ncbi:MAG TPA: hypothetical protein VFE98_00340 [Candidatus Bathyarchaeia archaeon]|nr:hypothetical protein [Candidatus Bathyarchaeia archaeon]
MDRCPLCGALVKEDNLPKHYAKVHPRRVSPATKAGLKSKSIRQTSRLFKHRRMIIVGILLAVALGGTIVAATDYVNANTVRQSLRLEISARIYGLNVTIPKDIGINSQLWQNHMLDRYGVHGMSPIHTRDTTGSVEIESNAVRDYYFHDFLAVWGQTVNSEVVLGRAVGNNHTALIVNRHFSSITENPVLLDGETIQIILDAKPTG